MNGPLREGCENALRRAVAPGTVTRVNREYLLLERPSWRGVLHSWAFFASIPAGVLLIVFAAGAAGRTAASIYTATLLLVFGTSAAYHRLAHSLKARRVMQRLDHSMIFLLIAGTYVPLCLVALPLRWGIPLLASVSAIGLLGIVIKLTGTRRLHVLGYALYPVMGWGAVVAAPVLWDALTGMQLALVVAGGASYTIGLPVLLLKRPDPWPRSFGYHEVWHGFTVLAAVLHFGAVASMVA